MTWKSWEDAADSGPEAFVRKAGCFVVAVVIPIVFIFAAISYVGGWFAETGRVAQEQLGPAALLKKYEWFKDAAAALDAKLASIKVYEGRFTRLKQEYAGKPRSEWPREDREQANLWESEVAGIRASYNLLCAQYNSAMSKVNYQFCNVGGVPAGGKVLQREYREYEEK